MRQKKAAKVVEYLHLDSYDYFFSLFNFQDCYHFLDDFSARITFTFNIGDVSEKIIAINNPIYGYDFKLENGEVLSTDDFLNYLFDFLPEETKEMLYDNFYRKNTLNELTGIRLKNHITASANRTMQDLIQKHWEIDELRFVKDERNNKLLLFKKRINGATRSFKLVFHPTTNYCYLLDEKTHTYDLHRALFLETELALQKDYPDIFFQPLVNQMLTSDSWFAMEIKKRYKKTDEYLLKHMFQPNQPSGGI